MQNFLKKTKNNDYFKLYIRLLKEQKLYNEEHKKNYISELRLKKYPNCGNDRKFLKHNSIMFNIEIPNMLIANEVAFHDFVLLYNKYNRNIAPSIAMQIINKLCKEYNMKLTNKIKQEKQKLLVNFFKTKLFFDSNDDRSFMPIDSMVTKILTKTRTLINEKITRNTLEKILFNSVNNKIIYDEI